MPQKLIDGNITIEDKASAGLSKIEAALKNVEKIAKPVTKQMRELNKEISKMQSAPMDEGKIYNRTRSNVSRVKGFDKLSESRQFSIIQDAVTKSYRQAATANALAMKSMMADIDIAKINAKSLAKEKYFDRLDANVSLRGLNRQASITQQEGLRMTRQDALMEHQRNLVRLNEASHMAQIAEREASLKRLADYKAELALKTQQAKMEQRLAQQENKLAGQMRNRTDWQNKMLARANKGGRFAPLWASLGKAESISSVAKNPSLISEGLMGSFKNFGKFGKGLAGFAGGRIVGGMFGSSMLGGLIGGGIAGGPVGIAIAGIATALISGFNKITNRISEVIDILNEISAERATESTSLRRKMQMSSEMFGVDPRDIANIDKKIYGLRDMEQQFYRKGMAGRDITTSAIDWLHLLGTKSSGGVFANEKQAFDFSAALSSIAKMNGLSEQEYETVRYQGMQILSKGYADILDVKPLLNSAPGFVRDLLQQTGMTRREFLESGRSRSFTSDKFIDALMGVKDYYEILSERMSSRTAEQQEEAAKNIVGAAAVWDELYKKNKAESNEEVANAIIRGGIANDIKESWYQMWATTNDAADGALAKANIEKQITNDILQGVLYIYGAFVLIKNAVELIVDSVLWVVGQIGAVITNVLDFVGQGFLGLFGVLFQEIGKLPGMERVAEWGEQLNPNSQTRKRERMREDLSEKMADKIYSDYQTKGAKYVEEKYGYILNQDIAKEIVTGTAREQITHYDYTIPDPYALAPMGYEWVENRLTKYGYTGSENMMDKILYGGSAKDKAEERFVDKSKLKEAIAENFDMFIKDGEFKSGYSNFNPDAVASSEVLTSSAQSYRTLAEDFGLKHGNVDEYSWLNSMADRHRWVNDATVNAFRNDLNDSTRVVKMIQGTAEDTRKAFEDVKAPYVEKLTKLDTNVADIKKGQGKGNAQILDILKEIAGITVINKVTRVRPDVVFNFGSYGRSGKNEDPNLRAVGDKLNSFYNDEENKILINGVQVLNEAG